MQEMGASVNKISLSPKQNNSLEAVLLSPIAQHYSVSSADVKTLALLGTVRANVPQQIGVLYYKTCWLQRRTT